MAESVDKVEFPTAFEEDNWPWGEEDECEEEEDAGETYKHMQKEAEECGMIQVGAVNWHEEVRRKLSEVSGKDIEDRDHAANIDREIEKMSKSTCIVRRGCNSQKRIDLHERLADRAKSDEKKEYHMTKAGKAKKGVLGVGTGLLLAPKSRAGYLVITNNHVIMDEEEAKDAKVAFDFLTDGKKDGITVYKVHQFFAFSEPTADGNDEANLDFSILTLEAVCNDVFLKNRGVYMEETVRVQAVDMSLKMVGLKALPLVMFSHPGQLAMRISIGPYPKGITTYPVSHIKHNLVSFKGSSGANLLLPNMGSGNKSEELDEKDNCFNKLLKTEMFEQTGVVWRDSPIDTTFTLWKTAFLHYRNGCAVAWQAIGPQLRAKFTEFEKAMPPAEKKAHDDELWETAIQNWESELLQKARMDDQPPGFVPPFI